MLEHAYHGGNVHVLEPNSVTMTTVRLGLNLVASMTGRTDINDAFTQPKQRNDCVQPHMSRDIRCGMS